MVRLTIITEGQTEETYIRDVLYFHLEKYGIYTTPITLVTAVHSRTFRGGIDTHYQRVRRDILRALNDKEAMVTTMLDLYRLPPDFPGFEAARKMPYPHEKVQILEDAMADDIDNQRFIPYIQLHEFEALLFSDIATIDDLMRVSSPDSRIGELKEIMRQFQDPEKIDDSPATAPSKRLIRLYPAYQKVTDGIRIAEQIPLTTIREECRHFNRWITLLEELPG